MPQPIYFDYAAATPIEPLVAKKMGDTAIAFFGNPSSAHRFGRSAQKELLKAQKVVADFIGASPEEIFFTSGGTESNNLAILGVARANQNRGKHLVTTKVEHPSILNACRALEKDGWQVTYLPVDQNAQVSLSDLKKAIKKETVLCSIHYGNSELGTLSKIEELSKICREQEVLLHVDACQAMAYQKIDVTKMGIDLLTFNGSKMYGPRGVGVLYVRSGINIFPIFYGGGQQQSLRSGTENLPGIVGLAAAVKIVEKNRQLDSKKISQLRDWLQGELEKTGQVTVNAQAAHRLPNHLSITLLNVEKTDLVALLDEAGIAVSAGSACSSKSIVESHVLTAIGLSPQEAQTTLRITLGRSTTKNDCQKIISAIKQIIK